MLRVHDDDESGFRDHVNEVAKTKSNSLTHLRKDSGVSSVDAVYIIMFNEIREIKLSSVIGVLLKKYAIT